jgi:flagellar capping protein FliD
MAVSATPLEARIASLEGSYHQVSDRLNSIDRRLDGFEQKAEVRFNTLDSKIDGLQWRMTALIVGTWITVMASIFFHR